MRVIPAILLTLVCCVKPITLHAFNAHAEALTEQDEPVFREPDSLAQFPGGQEKAYIFLRDNLKYPSQALKDSIQGRVVVRFVVEKNGEISNLEVIRSAHKLLDAEALRVLKTMPNWKPAVKEGKPVRSLMNLPIMFRVNSCSQSCTKQCKGAR